MTPPRVLSCPLLLLLCWAAPAQAQERAAVDLLVTRADGAAACPATEALADAVRSRLGFDPFRPDAPLRVRVAFSRRPRELLAEIRSEGPGAALRPRTLRSRRRDCAALSTSVVLTLVLSLDGLVAEVPPAPLAPPPVAPPPPPPTSLAPPAAPTLVAVVGPSASPPVAPPPPRPRPRPIAAPRDRWTLRLGLDLGVAVGLSPEVSAGLGLGASLERRRFALGLDLRAYLPSTERQDFGAVAVVPVLAGLTGCVRGLGFSGCALVLVGALVSEGQEVIVAHAAVTPHLRAGLRASWSSPALGAVRLRVAAEVHGALTPTEMRIDRQTAWASPAVAATFALGVELAP